MKKKIISLFMSALMITALVGCGAQKDESTLNQIKEKEKFTYALTGAYPPFNYIDEKGKLVGFDVDIANALAEKMGVEAEPVTTQWDGIIGGLKSKRFDTIIGSYNR